MAWFKPKGLLDDTYEIGIILKGIDGAIELIGGLIILLIKPEVFEKIAHVLTARELNEDPNSFIATHILQYGQEIAHGHNGFAAIFLLSHGIVKIILVVSLLRNLAWAYPFALITLGAFTVYQFYLLAIHATLGITLLTILDIFIMWLVWREWQKQKLAGSLSGDTTAKT